MLKIAHVQNFCKPNRQKRRLDDMVVDGGQFTIDKMKEANAFSATDIKAMLQTTEVRASHCLFCFFHFRS